MLQPCWRSERTCSVSTSSRVADRFDVLTFAIVVSGNENPECRVFSVLGVDHVVRKTDPKFKFFPQDCP